MAESIFSGASRHASRGSMSFEVSIREHQMGLERGDTEAARTSSENDSAEVEKPVPPAARRKAGASALLENVPLDDRITLTWNNVDAYVPSSMIAPGPIEQMRNLKQKAKAKSDSDEEQHPGTKQILHKVRGSVLPGEVLALMGPSGSGKTSLVSVLGGRVPQGMTLGGQIEFNKEPLNRKMKRSIGYVLQDDALFSALTVYETLYYAARLRLPRDMPMEEKLNRVEAVIAALGLGKCRNTMIGNAQMRGVSGGERKRVSVGHELLINPAVLMLDEPTSGLDSTTAMNLMDTLRELATGGRAVVTTIHQPSSRLYMKLDKLILLADGRAMYSGRADLVHAWFDRLGCKLPYGMNVADYILDLSNGELSGTAFEGRDPEATKLQLARVCTAFTECYEDGVQRESDINRLQGVAPKDGGTLEGISVEREERVMESRRIANIASLTGGNVNGRLSGAGFAEQIRILLVRSLKTRRFESLGFQKFLQFVTVAVIAGLLWYQRGNGDTLKKATDTAGLLFFEMIFMSFGALFAALFTFPSEIGMLLKERASGMYSLAAFYISRTASDLPLDCMYPTVFVIIVYFLGGLRLTVGAFLANWISVIVTVLCAQSYGLLIGASVRDVKAAQTLATVTMLTFMLVGGFWVQQIPSWIVWLRYFSYIYWSYSLLAKIQYRDHTYYDCNQQDTNDANDITDLSQCTVVTDVKRALALPRDVNETVALEVGILLAMLVVLRLLVYAVLKYKTRKA